MHILKDDCSFKYIQSHFVGMKYVLHLYLMLQKLDGLSLLIITY